jgi:hypothetical protein
MSEPRACERRAAGGVLTHGRRFRQLGRLSTACAKTA